MQQSTVHFKKPKAPLTLKMGLEKFWLGLILTALSLGAITLIQTRADAESLFRTSAVYNETNGYRPNSLFTQPIPHSVGDILTIIINERQTMTNTTSLKTNRSQDITENGANIMNRIIHKIGVPNNLSFPSLNGLSNSNELESTAQANRTNQLRDTVTVQVVQILPNGNLVVQGNKVALINKDNVNLMITGIVNPFYLNPRNEIPSAQVANFQMLMGGEGILTRQQNDGLANKIFRFFQ